MTFALSPDTVAASWLLNRLSECRTRGHPERFNEALTEARKLFNTTDAANQYRLITGLIALAPAESLEMFRRVAAASPSGLIRREAVLGLAGSSEKEDHALLGDRVLNDAEPLVRQASAVALSSLNCRRSLGTLGRALGDSSQIVAETAAFAISEIVLRSRLGGFAERRSMLEVCRSEAG